MCPPTHATSSTARHQEAAVAGAAALPTAVRGLFLAVPVPVPVPVVMPRQLVLVLLDSAQSQVR